MIAIQDLIAPALNGLGHSDDEELNLHHEGTCDSYVCFYCYKARKRWHELMVLKSELLKQIEEIDDELSSPSFL